VIIGVDQSLTGTGVVIIDEQGDIVHHEVIASSKKDGDVYCRVNNIISRLNEILGEFYVKEARIEGIAMGAKGHIADLGGLQHVIVNQLRYLHDMPVEVIAPKSLKKICTGNGNANKWMMFDSLPNDVKLLFEDEYKFSKREGKTISGNGFDATDAYHLAVCELSL